MMNRDFSLLEILEKYKAGWDSWLSSFKPTLTIASMHKHKHPDVSDRCSGTTVHHMHDGKS